jgi:threonine/homoserine/homoserine lactone efflux protein
MNLIALFITAFMVALSGALMPGPMLAVTLGHSPRQGWIFGPLAVVGHGILELGLVSMVFLGAGPLLQARMVQALVGLAGGVILVWMGKGMYSTARSPAPVEAEVKDPGKGRRAVLLGAVTSISNPYWTLWWATIGLAYLTLAAEKGAFGIIVFFLGHIAGDMAWYTLVSVAASRGFNVVDMRFYGFVMTVCSVSLVLLGLWFVFYGIQLVLA